MYPVYLGLARISRTPAVVQPAGSGGGQAAVSALSVFVIVAMPRCRTVRRK
jgi:hypothetical protein